MKLFVLIAIEDVKYEPAEDVIGIYSDREKAEKELSILDNYGYGENPMPGIGSYRIEEKELDAPAKKEY